MVDLDTGKRLVREVFQADQVFPSPQRERLPDLIVDWHDEPVLNGAYSHQLGRINSKLPDPRSGNHRPQGFAIFYGHGVEKQQISEGHIVDIVPTILKYFGLKTPLNFEGRPLTGVFGSFSSLKSTGLT